MSMAKTTTKAKKAPTKKSQTTVRRVSTTTKTSTPKKTTNTTKASPTASVSNKVDYYPNRVALLTAVAAVLILFVFAMIAVM